MDEQHTHERELRYKVGDELRMTAGILWGESLAGHQCTVVEVHPGTPFPYTVDIAQGFCIHVIEGVLRPIDD